MKKFNLYLSAVLVAAAIFGTSSASAATLIGNTAANVNDTVKTTVTTDVVNTTQSVTTQGNVGAEVTGSTGVSVGANYNVNSDTSAVLNIGKGSSIDVGRANVSSDSKAGSEASVAVTADRVANQNDLRAFAETSLKSDANLEGIIFSDSDVKVVYKARGKFLAIIPVDLKAVAHVEANGEVDVSYPWYSFLVSGEDNNELEATMEAQTKAMVKANADGKLTARQSAEIAARVHAAFKNNFNATADVKANQKAQVNSNVNSALNNSTTTR